MVGVHGRSGVALAWPIVLAVLLAGATGLAVLPAGSPSVRLELGGFHGEALGGDWSRAHRARLKPEEAPDGRRDFYFRSLPPAARLSFPLRVGEGPLRVTLRGYAGVRCSLDVFVAGNRAGSFRMLPFKWGRYTIELRPEGLASEPVELGLALRPEPLVRGDHVDSHEVYVDFVDVQGARLSPQAALLVATVPLSIFLFLMILGLGSRWALLGSGLVALAVAGLTWASPVSVMAALPRLIPLALLSGLFVRAALSGRTMTTPRERAALAALVAAGILFHGSVVFFPGHNPPDIDIHARRSLDLLGLSLDYHELLRYGSQLPTLSQDLGHATEALGSRILIPYSPFSNVFYVLAHLLGFDLYWAMTAFNCVLLLLVSVWMWLVVDRLWSRGAAWLAALLFSLDLATWHHLGRSHAPAVFGGALATAALLFLALYAGRMDSPRRSLVAGVVLGTAALGYSSLVVLFGLFGLVLLTLLVLDARGLTPAARKGVAGALVIGGLVAGLLFYFHYVPGLLRGAASVEAEPDLFPGRTFWIFHNESRQSYRIWVLGYWIPLLAGIAAAPLALRRLAPASRPIVFSWFAAWALMMLLKEPFLFPKLLRWGKEDQFLSPLLCVLVAAAVWALPRAWMRWSAAAAALSTAFWLQLRDFLHHIDTLRLS